MRGHPISEETRRKISLANTGRTLVVAVSIGVIIVGTAAGQFLSVGPTWVIDPEAIAQEIKQVEQYAVEIAKIEQLYVTTVATYEHLKWQSQMLAGKNSWRYLATPLLYPSAYSRYGTNEGWMGALNKGIDAVTGYERATIRETNPYVVYGQLSELGQDDFSHHYATVELSKGSSIHAMEVSGNVRANLEQNEATIAALEDLALSDADDDNTQIAVLNKINGAGMVQARQQQDTTRLLAALLDQQAVEAKGKRDMMMQSFNDAEAMAESSDATQAAIWDGHRAAKSTRLP